LRVLRGLVEASMRVAWWISVFVATVLSSSAQAQIKGNDTGGIMPWSCETELHAPEWTAQFCAGYGKYSRITSVHREYGEYIAFNCLWTPYVAPYALPAVRTRDACAAAIIKAPIVKALN
jgi:hypothetical protein